MTIITQEQYSRVDIDQVRRDNPLPAIAGASLKLIRAGREYKACCPFHDERSPSFTIFEGGNRFHCFGCGANGDVLDYVSKLHGVEFQEAARMLGAGNLPMVQIATLPPADNRKTRLEALGIWRASRSINETLAASYLYSRGIRIGLRGRSLRYSELAYGKNGRKYPCLVAAITSVDGEIVGIQRTYLNDAGTGKAAVPKAKLSLGNISSHAIRLAPVSADLLICEGIEDGLSLIQESGRAAWASGGTAMLPKMLFPDGVKSVVIGADNDGAGQRSAVDAASAFAERGLKARIIYPDLPHKDFNAQLVAEQREGITQ